MNAKNTGFVTVTSVMAVCTDCGREFGDDYVVHFRDENEAAQEITDAGWWVLCGGIVKCDECAAREGCRDHGHAWSEWFPCRCGCHDELTPPLPGMQVVAPMHCVPVMLRMCASCQIWDRRPVKHV